MDKEKFLKWLKEKTDCIIINTSDVNLKDKEAKAYLKGTITIME